jgi:HAD superfamily hydrolase (TIGR01509 family)
MPIEAVIFDMDGVLVDSEVYWLRARQEFARDIGKTWTDEDQHLTMGRNTIEWAHVMQERLHLDMPLDDIMAEIIRRVLAQYEAQMPLRPGALEAVYLAAKHYRVGLASGSPTVIIKRVMELTALDKVLEVIVFGDDVPNGKPAPDIYLKTAQLLGIPPQNCVGIEDSGNGIRSLHAAGMKIIAAPSPSFPLKDELLQLADRVIVSMEEITFDLLKSFDA